MTMQFRTLLDMVDTAVSHRAISQAMASFSNANGFEHHAFLELQGGGARYLSDYPEDWERVYLAQRFFRLDPVVTRARRSTGTFFWSAADWLGSPETELQSFACNAIEQGITHGLTISARASFDRQLLLTFANPNSDFRRLDEADLCDAVGTLMGLHYRMRQIGGQWIACGHSRLSSRELLCLTWAAKGKTAPETAIITRLSTRTVQHYLDAARAKLGAATVPHLVAISKDMQLI